VKGVGEDDPSVKNDENHQSDTSLESSSSSESETSSTSSEDEENTGDDMGEEEELPPFNRIQEESTSPSTESSSSSSGSDAEGAGEEEELPTLAKIREELEEEEVIDWAALAQAENERIAKLSWAERMIETPYWKRPEFGEEQYHSTLVQGEIQLQARNEMKKWRSVKERARE
jgi:hypothetical protein